MIPQCLKAIFSRHPVQCRSCAKRDVVVVVVLGKATSEQMCGDSVPGFPYRRDCKQYQYTWIYGDVEQEAKS